MNEKEIKKILGKVYTQSKEGNYEDALNTCGSLLSDYDEYTDVILRKRSHIHAYQNNIQEALNDRREIISNDLAKAEDYYFAAQYLIELGSYTKAIAFLTDGLELCAKQSTKAYVTDIYLLRAFAYLKNKEYLLAKNDCNSVEGDLEVFVQGFGFIPKKELLRKIQSRSS